MRLQRILSFHSVEVSHRNTWKCLSRTPCRTIQRPIAGFPSRTSTQTHQRKYSSSKTPNSSKQETRAINSATKVPAQETNHIAAPEPDKVTNPRIRRRKVKDIAQETANSDIETSQLNLPSVPSTQRIHPLGMKLYEQTECHVLTNITNQDIHVASFFSQHRPMSVSQVIPPTISEEAFSSLFEPPKSTSRSKAADIIYTLSSAIDTLDQAVAEREDQTPEELDLRTAVSQASTSAKTDFTPQALTLPAKSLTINLQELARNFRPFVPPPPPVPLAAMREAAASSAKEQKELLPQAKRTTWTSTLTVYESTHADGEVTYKTYATPIVRAPAGASTVLPPDSQELEVVEQDSLHSEEEHDTRQLPASSSQPFLGRMRERQIRYGDRMDERLRYRRGGDMLAISVKRQRKLKMKKHKYKKLMKRTKNLRRRLDRV